MVIMYLIIWAILGMFMYAQLLEGYYLEDASPKAIFIISILCGPLTICAYLFGMVKGLLILWLEYMEGEE